MFQNPEEDQSQIESGLHRGHMCPNEISRLIHLGGLEETIGQHFVDEFRNWEIQLPPESWFCLDSEDGVSRYTSSEHAPAVELEARVGGGIGQNGESRYKRLYIGCTTVDAEFDADIIHVNVLAEDMVFPASGPRILINGSQLPLRAGSIDRCFGQHIPVMLPQIENLLREVFRVLKPGGILIFAPSTHPSIVRDLLGPIGFVDIRQDGTAGATWYKRRRTFPATIIAARKQD